MKTARFNNSNKQKQRQFLVGCLVAVVLAVFLNQLALASRERFYTRNDILFLESGDGMSSISPECSTLHNSMSSGVNSTSGLSKDLMEIKNPEAFAKAIDDWVKKYYPKSPFVGLGKHAVRGGQRAGINPILPIIIARKESQLGTDPKSGRKLFEGNNAYGRSANKNQPHITTGRMWYKWNSLADSLFDTSSRQDDMYMYLKRRYSDTKTIDELMMRYAPPHENDTKTYIAEIKKWSSEIYQMAGDAIDQSKIGSTHSYDDCKSSGQSNSAGGGYTGGEAGAVNLGNFTMFYQYKGPWAKQLIGKQSCLKRDFAWCGCGPTSLAIVIANLTGNKNITPPVTRDKSSFPNGISHASLLNVPREYGLKTQAIGLNISRAREALQKGGLVILSQGNGALTKQSDGHILVIRGITKEGRFLVADPASERQTNNQTGYTASEILGGSKGMWVVMK